MNAESELLSLISQHGIAVLAPIAVLEGPVVTLIAAWLASLGALVLWQVLICVILADLAGDCALYGLGRYGHSLLPARWQIKVGLTRRRLQRLSRAYRDKGGKILIIGKLTHAAGFALLIGAGAARMPFGRFLAANMVATVPKSLALTAVGYLAGAAYGQIANGIYWLSLALIALLALALLARHRRREAAA